MSFDIPKGQATFRYGFSVPAQLLEFFERNQDLAGIAVVGRSNAGKSSLINAMFGKSTAKVSKTPGRTREVNTFAFPLTNQGKVVPELGEFVLFDLPGYGYAEVPAPIKKNWELLMETFFQNLKRRIIVIVIQDARHPNQKADLHFMDYLNGFNPKSFLVLNKLDKLKKQSDRAKLQKQKKQIFETYTSVEQIHFISAEKGTNLNQLKEALIQELLLFRESDNL